MARPQCDTPLVKNMLGWLVGCKIWRFNFDITMSFKINYYLNIYYKNLIYQLRIDFRLIFLLWCHLCNVFDFFFWILVIDFWGLKTWTSCLIKVLESWDIDIDFHCIWFVITKHVLYYKLANSYMYKPCLANLIASLAMHF
jgi:hypothetical protein